jgi:hypothetical protein
VGSRIVYQMAQDALLHGSVGRSHEINHTPHLAVYLVVPLMLLGPFVIILTGHGPPALPHASAGAVHRAIVRSRSPRVMGEIGAIHETNEELGPATR